MVKQYRMRTGRAITKLFINYKREMYALAPLNLSTAAAALNV